jgi:hypothetical protein
MPLVCIIRATRRFPCSKDIAGLKKHVRTFTPMYEFIISSKASQSIKMPVRRVVFTATKIKIRTDLKHSGESRTEL